MAPRNLWARAARSQVGRGLAALAPLLIAVLLTALIVALFGASPPIALAALLRGAFGSANGLSETLLEATPLLLTGLGVALAFRCHLWNIGAEGQLLVGGLAAITVGTRAGRGPAWLLLPLVLTSGAVAGAAWASIAALLRVFRGVPEVIATIMLNFLGLYLVSWATTGPLKEPGQEIPRTLPLPAAARLPALDGGLHAGLLIAVGAALLVFLLLFYTVPGYRIRAVGLSPAAAAAAGLPVSRILIGGFMLSGALAGLAGAVQLAGVTHRLYGSSSPGTGYTAIAVALVGRLHPIGVLFAALFFGALVAGSNEMQRTAGVSSVIASVIQALAVFLLITAPHADRGTGDGRAVH